MACAAAQPPKGTGTRSSPELKIAERSFSSFGPDEWDNFVLACGGSFLGSRRIVKARGLIGSVRLFEFLADYELGTPLKVGQCAILVAGEKVIFLDRIHLRPEQKHLQGQCFKLVVERFGAKTYHYGSLWNQEDRFELGTIPGFIAETVLDKQFQIDLIDFHRWADFPAYRRVTSENIRRDYRKAQNTSARIETRYALAAFRDLFALVTMRAHVMHKNKSRFSFFADYFRHAVKLFTLGKNGFITTVRVNGRCYSAFFGTQFGSNLFYNGGGTKENRQGFGSYLMVTLIEDWFSKHPTGKIFMGVCNGHCDPSTYTRGALLYRRKLRVSAANGLEFQLKVKRVEE